MRLSSFLMPGLCALALAASSTALAAPGDEAAAGRLLLRRNADTIVAVRCTTSVQITIGDRTLPSNDQKIEVNGTVIAAPGLTVTSLSSLDPRAVFDANRNMMNTGNMPVEFAKTDVKNLRLRLANGTEIPARIVGRDVEHDIAFLAPDAPVRDGAPLDYVNLVNSPAAASVLGNYYLISRASEALQRAALVRPCTVTGIIERPHRFLLVSTDIFPDSVGCPVFDPDGGVLGICLRCTDKGIPKGTVVVPAADIAALVPPPQERN